MKYGYMFFGILIMSLFAVGISFADTTAALPATSNLGSFSPSTSGGITTVAGDSYSSNVATWANSDKWSGIIGNITETVTLGAGSSNLFTWKATDISNVIAIYFANESNIDFNNLTDAVVSEIPAALTSGTDSWSATFNETCNYTSSLYMPLNMPCVTTNPTESGFKTYSLYDNTSGVLVWAGNIIPSGAQAFDGSTENYQVMLPAGTYNIWLEIGNVVNEGQLGGE